MAAIAPQTLWRLVAWRATQSPDRLLAVDDHGRRITFGDLCERGLQVAAGLHGRGVRADDVVSWQLPTWIESMVLAVALARLGAVQNPVIPANHEREVRFIVEQLGTRLLIVPPPWRGYDYPAMASQIQMAAPHLDVLVVDRDLPVGDPADLPLEAEGGQVSPVRWVLFTSGTTADPKGARHTDSSLLWSSRGMVARMRMGPDDRFGIAFPFTHIGGLTLLFANLLTGSASILLETFSNDGIEVFAREGVTLAGAGTAFNLAYLARQREQPGTALFAGIRAFPGGGATRPPDLHAEMKRVFGGIGVISGFGTTETGFLTMTDADDSDDVLATTEGRAYPACELIIRRADGTTAAAGESGEICARGPMVMQGYADPALDVAFDREGFFRTGDLGQLDAAGNLRVTGRLKDVIIRKGENISAREVEDLLDAHPAIVESAVIGVPDPQTGERCVAVVVCHDPAAPPSIEDLRRYLLDCGLAIFKTPEQLEIVDVLPRNSGGKVPKHELRARFAGTPPPVRDVPR